MLLRSASQNDDRLTSFFITFSSGFRRPATTFQVMIVSKCERQFYIFRCQLTIFWIDSWRISKVVNIIASGQNWLKTSLNFCLSNGNNILTSSNLLLDCPFIWFSIFFEFSREIRWFTTVTMNNFVSPFFVPSRTFRARWTHGPILICLRDSTARPIKLSLIFPRRFRLICWSGTHGGSVSTLLYPTVLCFWNVKNNGPKVVHWSAIFRVTRPPAQSS